jgi:hypothetical protein
MLHTQYLAKDEKIYVQIYLHWVAMACKEMIIHATYSFDGPKIKVDLVVFK